MTRLRAILSLLFSKGFYLTVRDRRGFLEHKHQDLTLTDAYAILDRVDEIVGEKLQAEENVEAAREIINQGINPHTP